MHLSIHPLIIHPLIQILTGQVGPQDSGGKTLCYSQLPLGCVNNTFKDKYSTLQASWWLSGKESPCQYRRCRRSRLDPWVGKIPWRRKWQPTPVFLPGKSHGGVWQDTVHGVAKELDVT